MSSEDRKNNEDRNNDWIICYVKKWSQTHIKQTLMSTYGPFPTREISLGFITFKWRITKAKAHHK